MVLWLLYKQKLQKKITKYYTTDVSHNFSFYNILLLQRMTNFNNPFPVIIICEISVLLFLLFISE